jgi:hypothetical protein
MRHEPWPDRVLSTAVTIEHLPHNEFQKCVARYSGDGYLKT